MINIKFLIGIVSFLVIFSACVPESKKVLTDVSLDPWSKSFQKISDLQYNNQVDSLIGYLSDNDPTQRYMAARAFASIQSPNALDSLYKLFDDESVKVRAMAAYAVGQTQMQASEDKLLKGFRQKDTMSVDNLSNSAILEAIGKLGNKSLSSFIATAEGYRDSDTILLEGQMQSLYGYTLRGLTTPEALDKAVNVLRNISLPNKPRLYAAQMLGRGNDLDIEKYKFQLAEVLVKETNPFIKMAVASSLKHTSDPEIQAILVNQLAIQNDYRVICNIIRTLSNYDYATTVEKIIPLIKNKNQHIANTAVEYIQRTGDPKDASRVRNVAIDSLPWQVEANLYKAVMSILPYYYSKTKNATRWKTLQAYNSYRGNVKAQAAFVDALSQDPESLTSLYSILDTSKSTIVMTKGYEAIGSILSHKDFYASYQSLSRSTKRKALARMKEAMLSKDEGIIAACGNAIADPNSGLAELVDSVGFINEAKASLKAPAQIESIHSLERALAQVRGVSTPSFTKVEEVKKVNWSKLKQFNANTRAIVKTTKGIFTMKFYFEEAPGTVLNFLELIDNDFYNKKIFHRVVPNFVIQTGSPRGDNYGGADYVIRSELSSLRYDDEGYVGMASAGLHTESTQWFVTHSPTPHLNGRYTIFGKIIEGMDVVHSIVEGDEIVDIIIKNL